MRTVSGTQHAKTNRSTTTHLKVYGLKDTVAAQSAYSVLGQLGGVERVHLDVSLRRASVTHQARPGMADDMIKALHDVGFRAFRKT